MKFKAGIYYVGDVCYVVKREDWMPLLEKSKYFNCETTGQWGGEYNGFPMFVASTAYGDGEYRDDFFRKYLVDAGVIGIMPVEALTKNPEGQGGQIITFPHNFEVHAMKGVFHFGDVYIDTSGEEEEEEYCPDCGHAGHDCSCEEYYEEEEDE